MLRSFFELIWNRKNQQQVKGQLQETLDEGTDPKVANRNLDKVDNRFAGLIKTAKRVGAAMIAAFAIGAVVRFTRAVFDAGKAIFDIGSSAGETADKFAITFGDAKQQVDDFLSSWNIMAGLTRTEGRDMSATMAAIAQGMGATKQASADLAEEVLRLAGDLTSFHDIPIEQALTAMRSGLTGEMEPLKRFGIILRAEAVNQRALTIAMREGREEITELDRMLARLQLAYEQAGVAVGNLELTQDSQANQARAAGAANRQLKETIATLLVEGFAAVPVFEDFRNGLEGIGTWVDNNEQTIRDLGTTFGEVAQFVIKSAEAFVGFIGWLVRIERELDEFQAKYGFNARARRQARRRLRADLYEDERRDLLNGGAGDEEDVLEDTTPPRTPPPSPEKAKTLKEEIDLLERGRELYILTSTEIQRAYEIEQKIKEELRRGNLTLERRIELIENLGQIQDVNRGNVMQMTHRVELAGTSLFQGGADPQLESWYDEAEEKMNEYAMDLQMQWGAVSSAITNMAFGVAGSWQDAFQIIIDKTGDVGDAVEALAAGMAGALLGGLADYASSKVAENVALAIEETAKGIAAGANPLTAWMAPGHFMAASQHGAAAAAWAALAGGAGAAQSSVAGGGRGGRSGGVPSGARDVGARLADQQEGGETHVHLWGEFDALNPRVQEVVHGANILYGEKAGRHAKLHVRGRSS